MPFLCDPITKQPLEIQNDKSGASLVCKKSGMRYLFIDDIPDLRPGMGIPLSGKGAKEKLQQQLEEKQREVMQHYDQKPCNNYMKLDNIPLGKWLRDPKYADWFKNLKFSIEVGSGKGAVAEVFKQYRGVELLCLDLAYGSLRHVRKPPLEADAILGSNMSLPAKDNVADMVVSYGVIHHTPDPVACFRELARILKPGGKLLLGVYNWHNLHRSLYFFFSPPFKLIRKIFGPKLGDIILMLTAFWPYHLVLWIMLMFVQHRFAFPKLKESWEQFGDTFLTPYARFYTKEEMISLGEILGLDLIEHAMGGWPAHSKAHFYWFKKKNK